MAASLRSPLVVILGATGTGKTKLSLELSRLFNGEIVSADSMQVYKGLDIITNKATKEEREICPHHLIDYISPLKQNHTVIDFKNRAVPVIDSLLSENKLPIVVGGTNYYIESILWRCLVEAEDVKNLTNQEAGSGGIQTGNESAPGTENMGHITSPTETIDSDLEKRIHGDDCQMGSDRDCYERMTNADLHGRLLEVDRDYALKLHPNNRRKIIRALEVYDRYGVPLSQVHRAQHCEVSDSALNGPLRYPRTCVFWLTCHPEVLGERLDRRVDTMIEQGLVEELTAFHTQYNEHRLREGREADYTTGIFQSIGFKEFHEYLILPEEEKPTSKGQKLLEKGIELLKMATRKYAKYQNKWVKNRFLKRPGPLENIPAVYELDCTDVSRWSETVATPATRVLTALTQGEDPPIQPLPHEGVKGTVYEYKECNLCNMVLITEQEWTAHTKSKKHKHMVTRQKKGLTRVSKTLDTYLQHQQQQQQQQHQHHHQQQQDRKRQHSPETDSISCARCESENLNS